MTGVRGHDLRLLPAALAVWAAAALTGHLPIASALEWGGVIVAGAWSVAGLALALVVAMRHRRGAGVAGVVVVALAGAALAVTSVVVSVPQRHPPELVVAADSRAAVTALVRVDTAARPLATGGVWFDATALRLDGDAVSAPVRVFLAEPGGRLPVASDVVLEARADGEGRRRRRHPPHGVGRRRAEGPDGSRGRGRAAQRPSSSAPGRLGETSQDSCPGSRPATPQHSTRASRTTCGRRL
ncbi:hypothetical protein Q0F99_20220 [Rathayibacter oskolensis]|uniref:hypothetical protein n=1 Tax=Rathayibacter oskolensis TaxID=1891671 RepID=UPI00265E05BD|nr:hypothetical protein [Rathayibacter oskolensis]WKK71607.1 hypothetical protein Q0F99_20220 [Rathayibacter oskolensis]